MADNPIVTITDKALGKINEIRGLEPDGDELALGIRIVGAQAGEFQYEMAMMRIADINDASTTEKHDDLVTFYPSDSIEMLRGATLDLSRDLLNPGLVIDNPNSPTPVDPAGGADRDLSGPVEQQIIEVLRTEINPAVASHGGSSELVAFEEGTAYLRLGGGCQGCGMATATLKQGIEATLRRYIPEVKSVVDVTDHAAGTNPYYEPATAGGHSHAGHSH